MKLRHRDTGEEFEFELPATIGRLPSCDVSINDASVSRQHLELSEGQQGPLARDLGSSNGTRHNGRPVKSCTLRNGDLLTIGTIALDVVLEVDSEVQVSAGKDSEQESHRVRSERARSASRAAKRSIGLGDIGQQSTAVQLLVGLLGLAFVAAIALLVRWLGGAL